MSGEGILPVRRTLFERMAEAQRAPEPFALFTQDPRFDPAAPITVNGFRFRPELVEDEDMGGAVDV